MSINKVHIVTDNIPKNHINKVVRSPHTTLIDGIDLTPHEIYPTYIDLNDYSSIHIYGSTDNGSHFFIMASGDKLSDYTLAEVNPSPRNTSFEFSVQLSNTARYISIYNGGFTHNLFLNYTLIR